MGVVYPGEKNKQSINGVSEVQETVLLPYRFGCLLCTECASISCSFIIPRFMRMPGSGSAKLKAHVFQWAVDTTPIKIEHSAQ